MNETRQVFIETTLKLRRLCHAAGRRDLNRAGIRLDPESWNILRAGESKWGLQGDIEIDSGGKATWRGLRVTIETNSMVALEKLEILTIECVDRRSGRTVYVNSPNNPEGYGG